jgi:hypothetical protein
MNRDEAKQLLPWYAVGALDADEARAVEAHLADSSELKRELTHLQVLHRSVGEVAADEPEFRPALINDALRQIDEYEASRRSTASRSISAEPGPLQRAIEWLRETLVTGWADSPRGARVAIAVQFAVLLVLGGVLLTPDGDMPGPGDPSFATLSGDSQSRGPTGGTAITVIFQPQATEQQMRGMMADLDADIVAGPTAQGNYTIRVDETDEAGVTAVLEQLRSNADVVKFAAERE